MSATADNPPAGWYPDPQGRPGQSYWDGQQWSDRPPAAGAAQTPIDEALGIAPYSGAPAGPAGAMGFGVDAYGQPLSDKSKLVAGLLQIFLPTFAVGRFYLGYTSLAVIQIVVGICTCGIGFFWPLIDGIFIILGKVPDAQGRTLRE